MSHRYPFTKLTLTAITYSGHILEKGRRVWAGSHILYRSSCFYNIIKRSCLIINLSVIQIHPTLLEAPSYYICLNILLVVGWRSIKIKSERCHSRRQRCQLMGIQKTKTTNKQKTTAKNSKTVRVTPRVFFSPLPTPPC